MMQAALWERNAHESAVVKHIRGAFILGHKESRVFCASVEKGAIVCVASAIKFYSVHCRARLHDEILLLRVAECTCNTLFKRWHGSRACILEVRQIFFRRDPVHANCVVTVPKNVVGGDRDILIAYAVRQAQGCGCLW